MCEVDSPLSMFGAVFILHLCLGVLMGGFYNCMYYWNNNHSNELGDNGNRLAFFLYGGFMGIIAGAVVGLCVAGIMECFYFWKAFEAPRTAVFMAVVFDILMSVLFKVGHHLYTKKK